MGIFWDLIQQSEIQKQNKKSKSLEERILLLENELAATKTILHKTLVTLEVYLKKDIDGDGKIG
ncbi:hypothetical protein [Polaribacter sp. M15]